MTTTEPTPAQKAAATRAANRERKNRALALRIARAWHANISRLYSADCGAVDYGPGPHAKEDWERYSKAWHRTHGPSRWKNAGVTRDLQTGRITIHPVRGRRIVLDTPRSLISATLAPLAALLDGDVYGVVEKDGTVTRYGLKGQTGVAVPSPAPPGFRAWPWEHGATVEECRAELRRKKALSLERYRKAQGAERDRLRADRRARLVLALCPNASATIEDARALGFCRAGIEAFQQRHGIGQAATLLTLVSTGNPDAIRLARHVAATLRK